MRGSLRLRRRHGLPLFQLLTLLLAATAMGFLLLFALLSYAPFHLGKAALTSTGLKDSKSGRYAHYASVALSKSEHWPDAHWSGEIDREASLCDSQFGEAWLSAWNSTVHPLCQPSPDGQPASLVHCRSIVDKNIPESTAPQVMCHASNLVLDPGKLRAAACPVHRPHYMCTPNFYNVYEMGAFLVDCEWPALDLNNYSRDHMRDIMEAFAGSGGLSVSEDATVGQLALLVTRESQEYRNVFHMMTDLFNTFLTLRMVGLGTPADPARIVVLLDNNPEGPLDGLWAGVAASGGLPGLEAPHTSTGSTGGPLVVRASSLPGPTLFHAAAIVPAGYASLFFAHLDEAATCPRSTELFTRFRDWVLGSLNLLPDSLALTTEPVRVLYVSRQQAAGAARRKVTRRVSNEDEIMAMLEQVPGADAQMVDLASLKLQDQLRLLTTTDLLIGMHGAALTWAILMPPHAGVIEFWPQASGIWRCYEHLSQWAGLLYRRWESPTQEQASHSHVETTVDVHAVEEIVGPLVREVAARKKQHISRLQGESAPVHHRNM